MIKRAVHCWRVSFLRQLPMLAVIVALGLAMWWSHDFFSELIQNLKDARWEMRHSDVRIEQYLRHENRWGESDSGSEIRKAYEALDRELTAWLTVFAITVGFFGLLVPLIGYLLQHHKLEKEREELREYVREFKIEQKRQMRALAKINKNLQWN